MPRGDDVDFPWTRFGRLVPLWPVAVNGRRHWECICDCGCFKVAQRHHLTKGLVRSCGCLHEQHGRRGTPEYEAWKNMKRHREFCPRWQIFTCFLADMGTRPSKKHRLTWINPERPYGPGNCRWSKKSGSKRKGNDDLTRMRSGRLVALYPVRVGGKLLWRCRCDCGGTKDVGAMHLKTTMVTSCGCIREHHGLCDRPEYPCWQSMRGRCNNPLNRAYPDYGGRGIRVCRRWRHFTSFFKDMGPRPTWRHSLDRIDVNGDYEPSNCRWATPLVQNRNRRNLTFLTLKGRTMCLQAWADELGICSATLLQRLDEWPLERALTESSHRKRRRPRKTRQRRPSEAAVKSVSEGMLF